MNVLPQLSLAMENIRIVVAPGQEAPGFPPGVTFSSVDKATINASGEIAFRAILSGTGIDSTNSRTMWVGMPDNLQLLAQEGQHAPGTAPDTVFQAFNPVSDGFDSTP